MNTDIDKILSNRMPRSRFLDLPKPIVIQSRTPNNGHSIRNNREGISWSKNTQIMPSNLRNLGILDKYQGCNMARFESIKPEETPLDRGVRLLIKPLLIRFASVDKRFSYMYIPKRSHTLPPRN